MYTDKNHIVPEKTPAASQEIGLVLAGGGTKGVYEIGAWKALEELGLMEQITGFSGSSIGAFNTALFVNGNLHAAIDLWESLTMADFADINVGLIRERIEEGKGHTTAEAFEQNIRVRYAAGKLADKATETAFGALGTQIDKISQALEKAAAPLSGTSGETDSGSPGSANLLCDNSGLEPGCSSAENAGFSRTSAGKTSENNPSFPAGDSDNASEKSTIPGSIPERPLNYNRHTGRNFWIWCLQNLFGCGYALPDRLREHLLMLLPADFRCPDDRQAFSTVCEWDAEKSCGGKACYVSWKHRNLQEILDLIIASASLPVLYPTREIGGRTYVDGGYADNEPIQPLYDIGYRKILIIYLDKYKGKKLKNIIKEQEEAYPGCEFLRLFPNKKFNDSFTKSCTISDKLTRERMLAGYDDGIKLFEKNAFFLK